MIMESLLKIYPDWQGKVINDDYDQIYPHELNEYPIPTREELEMAWATILEEKTIAEREEFALQRLQEIDLQCIRAMREWLAEIEEPPSFIVQYNEEARAIRNAFFK